MPGAGLEAVLTRAGEEGAKRVLADVGLGPDTPAPCYRLCMRIDPCENGPRPALAALNRQPVAPPAHKRQTEAQTPVRTV